LLVSIFSSLVFQECHVIQSTNHNRETIIFVCENYYYVLKNRRLGMLFHLCIFGCGENLTTNALKHLMDQLEERILQIDQLKNASKRLHRVDRTLCRTTNVCREVLGFLYLIVNQQFVVWQKHTNKISLFCNAPNEIIKISINLTDFNYFSDFNYLYFGRIQNAFLFLKFYNNINYNILAH